MKYENHAVHDSSIGNNSAGIMSVLAYSLGTMLLFLPYVKYVAWLVPLIIYLKERKSRLVMFHAMQALVLMITTYILVISFTVLTFGLTHGANFVGKLFELSKDYAINMNSYITWTVIIYVFLNVVGAIAGLMYKELKLPIFGSIADRIVYTY